MANVLTSKVGQGKRLHIVDGKLEKTLCGRYLDRLEHKMIVTGRKNKRICISCRCAERVSK